MAQKGEETPPNPKNLIFKRCQNCNANLATIVCHECSDKTQNYFICFACNKDLHKEDDHSYTFATFQQLVHKPTPPSSQKNTITPIKNISPIKSIPEHSESRETGRSSNRDYHNNKYQTFGQPLQYKMIFEHKYNTDRRNEADFNSSNNTANSNTNTRNQKSVFNTNDHVQAESNQNQELWDRKPFQETVVSVAGPADSHRQFSNRDYGPKQVNSRQVNS